MPKGKAVWAMVVDERAISQRMTTWIGNLSNRVAKGGRYRARTYDLTDVKSVRYLDDHCTHGCLPRLSV
jgi:hypothetical protein